MAGSRLRVPFLVRPSTELLIAIIATVNVLSRDVHVRMTFEKSVFIVGVVAALVLFVFWAIYHQWGTSLACLAAAILFSSRAVRKLRKQ